MKTLATCYCLAAACWLVMFSPWTAGAIPFWPVMTAATGVLAGLAIWFQRQRLRELFTFRPIWLLVGAASAAVLYGVFVAGRFMSERLFDFAKPEISDVYTIGESAPAWVIAVLLVLWIGPAEEIFWRGFIQDRLMTAWGRWPGFILAAGLYTAVHVWAFNGMLLVAALVCGVFWGWMMMRFKSLWPGLISHALWDVTIFVLLPVA